MVVYSFAKQGNNLGTDGPRVGFDLHAITISMVLGQ